LGDQRTAEAKVAVTVCTPTFNRAALLGRVFESLQAQTARNFEWLVVDDGSTDDTRDRVESWRSEANFPVRYFWKENGGKHTALNIGIAEARGELFVILDSDDVFPPQAVERAWALWNSIPLEQRDAYMGIGGLCAYQQDPTRCVTRPYPLDGLDTTYVEVSTRYGVWGDRVEFFVTELLRRVTPYPVFSGEKFVPEALLWNRLARRYRMRFFNEVLKVVEYREDGLTVLNARVPLPVRNPRGARTYFAEFAGIPHLMPPLRLLRTYASYVRFSLHAKVGLGATLRDAPSRAVCLVMLPIGVGAWLKDRLRYGGR